MSGWPAWNDRMPWVPDNRWDLVAHREPEPPRVSVVVTHYAQPTELARTLHALQQQDHPRELLEIIVADDGSPEEPVVPDGVGLVRQEDRGFRAAAARNTGAAATTGDVLCFLDADTTPEPSYVRRLSRLPALLPEAVTVGRRRHADLIGLPVAAPVSEVGPLHELPEPAWLRDAYAHSGDLLRADDRSYRYVISAVLGCTRSFFDEVGGFDESFSSYGGEDWEWAHRAWQAGGVFAHVRDAVAWHDGPDWAGRGDDDRQSEGNRQTMRLAERISVDGSHGRGLLPMSADLEVHLPARTSAAAAFVCVDSVLAAFPRAVVVVPGPIDAPVLRADPRVRTTGSPDPRVVLHLEAPIVVLDPDALASVVAGHSAERIGSTAIVSAEGVSLGRMDNRRTRRRVRRWGSQVTSEQTATVHGVHALRSDPHLEAWLGGWGDVRRFT